MPETEQQPWVELKNLRDELALTLGEMSALTGYSDTHLSDLERGRRTPNARTIARIATATGVDRAGLRPGAQQNGAAA